MARFKCAVNQEIDEEFEDSDWPFDVMPDNNLQALQIWDPDTGSRQLESVFILLVRADYSHGKSPPSLLYGGWNDCPVPQVHVGFLKAMVQNARRRSYFSRSSHHRNVCRQAAKHSR